MNEGNPLLASLGACPVLHQDNVPVKAWSFDRGASSLLLSLSKCKAKDLGRRRKWIGFSCDRTAAGHPR